MKNKIMAPWSRTATEALARLELMEKHEILFRAFKSCCWFCKFPTKTRKVGERRIVFCIRCWKWKDSKNRCHLYKYNKTQESPKEYDAFISWCLGNKNEK